MKNEKIVFVINKLGGQGWGGAHRVIAILANYFANNNYNTTLIVWEKSEIDYEINKKVNIVNLNLKINSEKDRIIACLKTRKVLKGLKGAYLYALMSRMAIDMLLSSLLLNIKIIGSERTDPNTEPKKPILRLIRNVLFKYMYKTVFQTNDAMNYFSKKVQKKGTVIFNPLSPTLIKPYFGERRKEFVTFCRIDKQKNLPLLIDSFIDVHKKHSDFSLHIYGNGLLEKEIKDYINNKNASSFIIMEGFKKEIHKEIQDSYAYINSSDYEGMSNSMLESLAIGLPSICTDCPIGGAKMIIDNRINGILVPVNDKKKLEEAINELIDNKKLHKTISMNSIKIREQLNQDIICKRWESLIK